MNINKVVFLLNELSPLNLAADWDNVGLLLNSKKNIQQKIGYFIFKE